MARTPKLLAFVLFWKEHHALCPRVTAETGSRFSRRQRVWIKAHTSQAWVLSMAGHRRRKEVKETNARKLYLSPCGSWQFLVERLQSTPTALPKKLYAP